jgi:hypothetical protein
LSPRRSAGFRSRQLTGSKSLYRSGLIDMRRLRLGIDCDVDLCGCNTPVQLDVRSCNRYRTRTFWVRVFDPEMKLHPKKLKDTISCTPELRIEFKGLDFRSREFTVH